MADQLSPAVTLGSVAAVDEPGAPAPLTVLLVDDAPSTTRRLLEHLAPPLPPDASGSGGQPARAAVASLTDREREGLVRPGA